MPETMTSLARTAKAIRRYDEIDAEADDAQHTPNAILIPIMERLEEAAVYVGRIFGEETAGINNPETCAQCVRPGPAVPGPGFQLSFVRRMVDLWAR